MRMTATGQVSIPERVRNRLGIGTNSEIDFKEEQGRFYLVKMDANAPAGRFSHLRGAATTALSSDEIMRLTRHP